MANAFAGLILASCWQNRSRVSEIAPGGAMPRGNRQTELQPDMPSPMRPVQNPFEGDEQALADGKRLYNQFNCYACHAAGGGAIGPPLMDGEWIYGSSAGNIFWTVVEGRPQGMPAFGGRVTEDQVWRITAYVRWLSGLDNQKPEKDAFIARSGSVLLLAFLTRCETVPPVPQRAFTAPVDESLARRERQVFLRGPCAMCHTIRETVALGCIGPDLTHLASRRTITAGTLPNTRGHLAGWILNPQNLKPGTLMPPVLLSSEDLGALLVFLETLK
jgi:cytochrome c oxidase cbb3-type subunit III